MGCTVTWIDRVVSVYIAAAPLFPSRHDRRPCRYGGPTSTMSVERREPSSGPRRRQKVEHAFVGRFSRALGADRLDADMVGAGVPVLLDASADRAFVAPRHHGVEKAIRAAASEIGIAEALATPTADIIVELQISGECLARGAARPDP